MICIFFFFVNCNYSSICWSSKK